jgi:hypothetical protein
MNIIEAIEAVKQAQQKVYHPKYTLDGDIVIFSSVSEDGVLKGKSLTLEHITPELLNGWCIYNVIDNNIPKDEEYKEQLDLCLAKMIVDISERGIECFYVYDLANVSSIRCFQQLLKDKEYGMKAITLLLEAKIQKKKKIFFPVIFDSILHQVFPWCKNKELQLHESNIINIEDWLMAHYRRDDN